jgi:two-component system response regulator HydG
MTKTRLIILVEYDPNLRQSIAMILHRAGYRVSVTDCLSKADEMLLSGTYNLIIADINIPGFRSSELQEVLGHYPSLPALILTDRSPHDIEVPKYQKSTNYLIKPIEPEILLDSIAVILKKTINTNHDLNYSYVRN